MSLYINTILADEHRAELVRAASTWRRRREAKQAAAAARAIALRQSQQRTSLTAYCHRAAAASVRSAG